MVFGLKDFILGSVCFFFICILSCLMGQKKIVLKYLIFYVVIAAIQQLCAFLPQAIETILSIFTLFIRVMIPVVLFASTFIATTKVSELIAAMYSLKIPRSITIMETRLYRLYDEIEGVENSIEEVKNRLLNIRQQKISEENVYQFLLYFDKLYDKFTDLEKKEFLNSFVEQVDIYEQEQPDGRFLKHIKFRFPVYFGDKETQELCWDNESTVETVCLLSRKDK